MIQLPSDFIAQMTSLLGDHEFEEFQKAIEGERITSIRTNERKVTSEVSNATIVPWCSNGFYLDNRPVFTMDPLFHAGCYYAQEASSMFVEQAVRQHWNEMDEEEPLFLDLCAAPGGKSTLLASLLNGKGWLVCNEVMKSRMGILDENITKWGAPNVTVTNNDPKDFGQMNGLFDLILIDAPCSGEGMFRKDDKAIEDWSLDNVQLCSERQRRIVADVFPALKEGGLLLYSTCTYNAEEDEKNVQWIAEKLGAEILEIKTEAYWNVTTQGAGYHFYPHKTKGEGFFLSILKKSTNESHTKIKAPKQISLVSKEVTNTCSNWLKHKEVKFLQEGDRIIAVPSQWLEVVLFFKQKLRVLHNALPMGIVKGKDIIPDEALALSWELDQTKFPAIECTWEQAIQYLKKENIQLEDAPKGIVLFCFNGIPLGFGKNLGNRCNNLYPSEWHIRMNAEKEKYTAVIMR